MMGHRFLLGRDFLPEEGEVGKDQVLILTTALAGAGLGIVGAFALGRAKQGMSYQIGAVDPVALAVVATVLLASALLACLVPARRAASVDPMAALRQD